MMKKNYQIEDLKIRDNLFAALFFVMVVDVIILTGCANKNNSVSNNPDTVTTSVTDGTDAVSVSATGDTSLPDSSVQTDQTVTENPTITDVTISPSETLFTLLPENAGADNYGIELK